MFILVLLQYCGSRLLYPMPGCLKLASAAAVQCQAAPQGLSVLVRASAVDHGWSFEVQSTATGQYCLRLRPKTRRRGAWLTVGGNFGVPVFVAGAAPAPGTALGTALT